MPVQSDLEPCQAEAECLRTCNRQRACVGSKHHAGDHHRVFPTVLSRTNDHFGQIDFIKADRFAIGGLDRKRMSSGLLASRQQHFKRVLRLARMD